MTRVVVGIDPDSDKHGIAVFDDGVLTLCGRESTVSIVENYIKALRLRETEVLFAIEDVMANKFVYARNERSSKAAQSKVAMHIGRCQQAQVELIAWLEHLAIPYQLFKPQQGNWAINKAAFERATGWQKSSNADGRSAAYFGFLALRKKSVIDVPKF